MASGQLLLRALDHLRAEIEARDVPAFGEVNEMRARDAAGVDEASSARDAFSIENFADPRGLLCIVLVLIDRVIDFGIVRVAVHRRARLCPKTRSIDTERYQVPSCARGNPD